MWQALGQVTLLPQSQEDYHGLDPSGDSLGGGTVFSIRRAESELPRLSQPILSPESH